MQLAVVVGFVVSVVVIARIVYLRWTEDVSSLRLPPGPKPIPLLGNVHQLSMVSQEKTFANWGKLYGGLVYAQLFRTPAIVINSLKAAQDLLDAKSANYSHRPRFVLLSDLMGWDCVITHMTYGERFRKHRRWIAQAFEDKDALISYRALQRREAYVLISGLFESPGFFRAHIRRFAAAMIMEIAYGHSVTSLNDQFVHLAERAAKETIESGGPGSMIVDFFPLLRHLPMWLPGAGFKRKAHKVRLIVRKMLDAPFEMVKTAMMHGTASPSFTATLLEEVFSRGTPTTEEEDDIKGAAGVLFGAATDTTSAVLSTFILAMTLHPDIYKKARAEIDRVVGTVRLPDFPDRDSLPYLECVLEEVYRWNCPVPLGLPHKAAAHDQYRGYDIPGGSMIIPNIWAMTRDTQMYASPESFIPERFQGLSREDADLHNPRNMVFGFGRRACPGRKFADASIWFAAANIIATVNISQPNDLSRKNADLCDLFIPGFVSHPRDFICNMTPRSRNALEMVSDMRVHTAF
ncbi:cytochrome P450 [Laetiporus sulphureus 93-53]|uniref:Cytochrome P450 n=1 Tax=Laetiporus sulphureus 93-53 TaxID=1314785 RepID=A0A165I8D5_9APHY|nr:cytochrome P450 [Laetiporus sulphureus 93-53]KZT12723.1 cytochrome P450 [Laetiporus sulphureus 93-53]